MTLGDTLIQSCTLLHKHKDNILNDDLLEECKKRINPNNSDTKSNTNEKNIFGENRRLKVDKYDIFIKDIHQIVDNLDYDSENTNILKTINTFSDFLDEITKFIEKKLINKYYTIEEKQYHNLKNNYNNIENNRHKLKKLNNININLNSLNEIEKFKLQDISNVSKYIFLLLVIIFLGIVLVIIYIKFIKNKNI